jgi:hypothetical protein
MNSNSQDDAGKAGSPAPANDPAQAKKLTVDKKLHDPHTYEEYDEAMGELSDADGAASLGGPAA